MIYACSDISQVVIGDRQQTTKEATSGLAPKDVKFDVKDGKIELIDRAATKFLDGKMAAPPYNVTPPPVDGKPVQPRTANKPNPGPT